MFTSVFITDAYSHKIVGYRVAETLEAVESLSALEMALESFPAKIKEKLNHHSDRGYNIAVMDM